MQKKRCLDMLQEVAHDSIINNMLLRVEGITSLPGKLFVGPRGSKEDQDESAG